MLSNRLRWSSAALVLFFSYLLCPVSYAEADGAGQVLATAEIREPVGQNWRGQWLRETVIVSGAERPVDAERLLWRDADGDALPAAFTRDGDPVEQIRTGDRIDVLFRTDLASGRTAEFALVAMEDKAAAEAARAWRPVRRQVNQDGAFTVANGHYELHFDPAEPEPANAIRLPGSRMTLGRFRWSEDASPVAVEDRWQAHGEPAARAELVRTFRFQRSDLRYQIRFTFSAETPWIEVREDYRLGRGAMMELDLRGISPESVRHAGQRSWMSTLDMPPAGSTLETEFYPIATVAPLAPPGWTNTSPWAYVASGEVDAGLGVAAIRAGDWRGGRREGHAWLPGDWREHRHLRPESQLISIRGDRNRTGQVRIELPLDGGVRHWALIPGPHDTAGVISGMIRNQADHRVQRMRDEWVLEWESDAPAVSYGFVAQWLNGPYMRPLLGSSSYPRRIKRWLDQRLTDPEATVHSRDLAVMAYMFRDPNYHPSPYHPAGWYTGNPNGHLDMFNIPMRIGLLMPDHPHAEQWVADGVQQLKRTLNEYMSFEGGAWTESLSYSSFYFHYVQFAREICDRGVAEPFRDWPRLRESARYLAAMHTPVDARYGRRQRAPLGDTHPGHYIDELRELAEDYRGIDDEFAEQLARFPDPGDNALDISGREFPGFGAMLRGHAYDERRESFATLKAGAARNHFAGDEMAVYFAGLSTPLAIEYACHYSPRLSSAAIHNRPHPGDLTPVTIATARAFESGPEAEVFVADEQSRRLTTVPLTPHETVVPSWDYPEVHWDRDNTWLFRRYAMLVRHEGETNAPADFLVLRDEIDSPEPVWWNLHVLAHEIERIDERTFRFQGQLGVDMTVFVFGAEIQQVQKRKWGWRGGSGDRRTTKFEDYERELFGAWIPEDFEKGTWGKGDTGGEMARWLRLKAAGGRSDWLVVLMPHRGGEEPPIVEQVCENSVRVRHDGHEQVIHLGSDGDHQAAVVRNGDRRVLLDAGAVGPWEQLDWGFPAKPDLMPWQY